MVILDKHSNMAPTKESHSVNSNTSHNSISVGVFAPPYSDSIIVLFGDMRVFPYIITIVRNFLALYFLYSEK